LKPSPHHENQPLIQDSGLVVEWRPDHPIDDAEYDRDFLPPAFDGADDDALADACVCPLDPDELAALAADVVPLMPLHPTLPPWRTKERLSTNNTTTATTRLHLMMRSTDDRTRQ
jgi:hypothetical protein